MPTWEIPPEQNSFMEGTPVAPKPSFLERFDLVVILLAINGAFYLAAQLLGGTADPGVLVSLGANYPEYVARGEVWRFLSSMFLHAGPVHLLVNGYSFFILGRFVERLYGRTRLLAVFLATGMLASLTSYLLTTGLSVGASGGIAGLLGLVTSFVLRFRDRLNPLFRRRFLMNLNLIVLVNVFLGAAVPGIDVWAHAGGFAAGMLAGWLARPILPGDAPGDSRRTRPLALGALSLLLATWTCLGLYLLFAVAAPRLSPRSLYSEKSGLFQFRYPAWFTIKQAPPDDEALLVTNLHNATFAVFLISEDDYQERLAELVRNRAERGPLAINGMEGMRAAGTEHGREGMVFYYQILLRGAAGTGGENLAVVFLATADEPIPAPLRELMDQVSESFYFVNRLVI